MLAFEVGVGFQVADCVAVRAARVAACGVRESFSLTSHAPKAFVPKLCLRMPSPAESSSSEAEDEHEGLGGEARVLGTRRAPSALGHAILDPATREEEDVWKGPFAGEQHGPRGLRLLGRDAWASEVARGDAHLVISGS